MNSAESCQNCGCSFFWKSCFWKKFASIVAKVGVEVVKSAFKKDCGDYEYSWEDNECAIVFDEEDCGEGKIFSIYFVKWNIKCFWVQD